MFLGIVDDYTSVAGEAIPFETVINSNNKITNEDGVLSLNKPGYWNIDASLVVTSSTARDFSIVFYVNDEMVDNVVATATLAQSGTATLTISTVVRTVPSVLDKMATISIRGDQASANISGTLRVEYVQ